MVNYGICGIIKILHKYVFHIYDIKHTHTYVCVMGLSWVSGTELLKSGSLKNHVPYL